MKYKVEHLSGRLLDYYVALILFPNKDHLVWRFGDAWVRESKQRKYLLPALSYAEGEPEGLSKLVKALDVRVHEQKPWYVAVTLGGYRARPAAMRSRDRTEAIARCVVSAYIGDGDEVEVPEDEVIE